MAWSLFLEPFQADFLWDLFHLQHLQQSLSDELEYDVSELIDSESDGGLLPSESSFSLAVRWDLYLIATVFNAVPRLLLGAIWAAGLKLAHCSLLDKQSVYIP